MYIGLECVINTGTQQRGEADLLFVSGGGAGAFVFAAIGIFKNAGGFSFQENIEG